MVSVSALKVKVPQLLMNYFYNLLTTDCDLNPIPPTGIQTPVFKKVSVSAYISLT